MTKFYYRTGLIRLSLIVLMLMMSTACDTSKPPSEPIIRSVKVYRIKNIPLLSPHTFAGEIKARYETILSFRVAGKLSDRLVEVGDSVQKGQILVKLDANDYRLAVLNYKAQHQAVLAEQDFSQADVERYRELLLQKVISPPELDKHETALIAVEQKQIALAAQLAQARNQLAYTELRADRDGVVTSLEAERGQVVSAGQPIVKLTETAEKEVFFDMPEGQIEQIRVNQPVNVTLWVNQADSISALIREIGAVPDSVSRTFRVKATLLESSPAIRIGMTATVKLPSSQTTNMALPLAAVFSSQQEPKLTKVWVVDESTKTVKSVSVTLGQLLSNEFIETWGLEEGQLVVCAGVQRVREGQQVNWKEQTESLTPAEQTP